jgi:cobalt-precorrin-5B (C1)-methyltransferase
MQDDYIFKNGKPLRQGFSTGSCAAAAAKAAVLMFFSREVVEEVCIVAPENRKLCFTIDEAFFTEEFASCCVVKDAGDDPDVTHGIQIYARAFRNNDKGIKIAGGEGIGIVTKKGLAVEVGQPAINPVPMQMIVHEVSEVLPAGEGVCVEISAPAGVVIAQKTFNPQLGIQGGISILGTKGIVSPMSDDAYKDSLSLKLSMLNAMDEREAVFIPGNYAERFINANYPINPQRIVVTSNFIGFMLDEAVRYKFEKILLIGHIGKLIKVAGGIFNTHSRIADGRNEIFSSHYLLYSGNAGVARQLMHCNTTEEAVSYVNDPGFYNYIGNKIKERCNLYVRKVLETEVILFSESAGLLGGTRGANVWIETYFKKI